ncbi:MAG: hypothetical protein KY433_06340 [Actinobacteria bacterium]|nr:hypothetical protein [Actinomycetota bacterium]
MRKIKVSLAALGTVGALAAFAPGAVAQGQSDTAPGHQCPNQGTLQSNAMEAHQHANLGQSTEHMGMGHGPGEMSKGQPWCMREMP